MNEAQASTVRHIFRRYVGLGSVYAVHAELERDGVRTKVIPARSGRVAGRRSDAAILCTCSATEFFSGKSCTS